MSTQGPNYAFYYFCKLHKSLDTLYLSHMIEAFTDGQLES